ncbi:MAG: hypothetical protein AB1791_20215 [Chloroflexota bacterium]
MSTNVEMVTGKPAAKSGRGKLILGCAAAFLIISCAVGGGLVFLISSVEGKLEDGLAAMSDGNCGSAIENFDQVSGSAFATSDTKLAAENARAVCQQYLNLVAQQNAGDGGSALAGYDDLLLEDPSSPLAPTIEQNAQAAMTADPAALANAASCPKLGSFLERGWLPDLDAKLPLFYQACGQVFVGTGDYSQAVAMFQRFVTAYPNHPAFEDVKQALAKAAVAEARAAGAGEIAPPQSVGGSGSGPAVVVIQNDSPEQLSLIFSGPEAVIESLDLCLACTDFTTDPEFCPELGPIGRYEVPAGTYEVVVSSISDTEVTPFTGTWELSPGEEYYSCFFLVTE